MIQLSFFDRRQTLIPTEISWTVPIALAIITCTFQKIAYLQEQIDHLKHTPHDH